MEPLPPSGVWWGHTTRVFLSHQGTCGERVDGQSLESNPISAVLFFDENSVYGYGAAEGQSLTITGWWGSIARMKPLVQELEEIELWETGEAAISFILRDGSRDESCHAWFRDGGISGYRRCEGQ